MTIYSLIHNTATKFPQRTAVAIPNGPSVNYRELFDRAEKLSQQLIASGHFQIQDSISIVAPNGYPFLVTFLACVFARLKVAPLNQTYAVDEFTFYMTDTEAKGLLIVSEWETHNAREAAKSLSIPVWNITENKEDVQIDIEPKQDASKSESSKNEDNDVILFLHTSGTTSKPKGVPLTNLNIFTSVNNIIDCYQLTENDTSLIVMPLFHVHGLIGATLSTLGSGGCVVIPSRFSASEFWKQVVDHKVTWYSAVPTIHQIILLRSEQEAPPSDVQFRFVRSCSSSLAPITLEKLEKLLHAPILEAYGMTEASHQMASNPLPQNGAHKPGTVGKGTNVEIAILDQEGKQLGINTQGEICIRGKNVTLGYHNRPEANAENFTKDGWFRTGDQGTLDDEGYLTLTGRIKELINRGGEKISPVELDSILLEHPSISAAVAFGVPDEKYGEVVNAAVVLKENATLTEDEIKQFVKSKLADFKVPSVIFITDDFPRTATGKVQRRFVAEYFLSKSK